MVEGAEGGCLGGDVDGDVEGGVLTAALPLCGCVVEDDAFGDGVGLSSTGSFFFDFVGGILTASATGGIS